MPAPATADPLPTTDWRYTLHRHLKWAAWWEQMVYLSHGDLAAARRIDAVRAACLRASQAEWMPGVALAYLTGLVTGKWAGE